jgi:pyridoxal phosphate enzyme (YggS family)
MNILNNFIQIKNEVLSLSNNTKIVVVTKTFDINTIKPIIDYGHKDFGENKVQEAKLKWSSLISKNLTINLHFIGKLQTNKVSDAVKLFSFIHSLSTEKLAKTCMEEESLIKKRIKYFIQINFSDSDHRNGIEPKNIKDFVKYCIYDLNLNIIGLMCIPPLNEVSDLFFSQLRKIANKNNLFQLSMGMSNDYPAAIKNGSNYVRIGSKIFGDREIK